MQKLNLEGKMCVNVNGYVSVLGRETNNKQGKKKKKYNHSRPAPSSAEQSRNTADVIVTHSREEGKTREEEEQKTVSGYAGVVQLPPPTARALL